MFKKNNYLITITAIYLVAALLIFRNNFFEISEDVIRLNGLWRLMMILYYVLIYFIPLGALVIFALFISSAYTSIANDMGVNVDKSTPKSELASKDDVIESRDERI